MLTQVEKEHMSAVNTIDEKGYSKLVGKKVQTSSSS